MKLLSFIMLFAQLHVQGARGRFSHFFATTRNTVFRFLSNRKFTTIGLTGMLIQKVSNDVPVVDEKIRINMREPGRKRYNLPQSQNTQFTKFEVTSSAISEHSSVVITRESSLKPSSQPWFDRLFLSRALHYTDPVAWVDVKNNVITIEPRSGLVGFVTTDESQLGIGGEGTLIVANTLAMENRDVNDLSVDPVFETAIVKRFTFDFYEQGPYLKKERTTYGPRAGSVTLTINARRDKDAREIVLEHSAIRTDPQGSHTKECQRKVILSCCRAK